MARRALGGSRLGELVRRSGPFVRAAHNEGTSATFRGVVQLSGFVRSQADIDRAVHVARGIAGAKSVKHDDPVAERIHGRAIWWWKRINSEELKTLR